MGLATLLRAGIADARQQTELARELYCRAAAEFQAAEMQLYEAIARRRAGGGGEADQWMTGQRIRDPARMAMMLAPARSA